MSSAAAACAALRKHEEGVLRLYFTQRVKLDQHKNSNHTVAQRQLSAHETTGYLSHSPIILDLAADCDCFSVLQPDRE